MRCTRAARPPPCPPHAQQVTLSVIEIYCERIKDLLEPSKDNLQVLNRGLDEKVKENQTVGGAHEGGTCARARTYGGDAARHAAPPMGPLTRCPPAACPPQIIQDPTRGIVVAEVCSSRGKEAATGAPLVPGAAHMPA